MTGGSQIAHRHESTKKNITTSLHKSPKLNVFLVDPSRAVNCAFCPQRHVLIWHKFTWTFSPFSPEIRRLDWPNFVLWTYRCVARSSAQPFIQFHSHMKKVSICRPHGNPKWRPCGHVTKNCDATGQQSTCYANVWATHAQWLHWQLLSGWILFLEITAKSIFGHFWCKGVQFLSEIKVFFSIFLLSFCFFFVYFFLSNYILILLCLKIVWVLRIWQHLHVGSFINTLSCTNNIHVTNPELSWRCSKLVQIALCGKFCKAAPNFQNLSGKQQCTLQNEMNNEVAKSIVLILKQKKKKYALKKFTINSRTFTHTSGRGRIVTARNNFLLWQLTNT